MKKVVSVILALCLMFNCFIVAAVAKDNNVANIYLCARSTASPFGHLWIYIENCSKSSLMVGAYCLEPGKGVSIGTWGTKGADGPGVYYNVEAYSVGHYGVSGIISAKDSLTEAELEKVSKEIIENNWWDPIVKNCMWFAFHIWNTCCDPFMFPFVFPFIGRLQMLAKLDTSRSLKMYTPKKSQVYKQVRNDLKKKVSDKMYEKIM